MFLMSEVPLYRSVERRSGRERGGERESVCVWKTESKREWEAEHGIMAKPKEVPLHVP